MVRDSTACANFTLGKPSASARCRQSSCRRDRFDAHEMNCKVLVARANKRGDYLAKFWCDDNLIQNYWFSLFNDRLYVSQTDTEP